MFFVDISENRTIQEKHKQISNKKTLRNIKVYQPLKPCENISESIREDRITQILKNIKIGKRQQIRRPSDKPLFKQFFNKYFLIDTKYSGGFNEKTILDELTEGSIRSVVLAQGNKYQFFKTLGSNY